MSYYYPFNHPISAPSSSFAQTATTASSADPSITVTTASFASAFINPGPQGPAGPSGSGCTPGPAGPDGPSGPSGSQGYAASTCPAGTKLCSSLTTGSHSIVCIQPRPNSDVAHTICPGSITGTVSVERYLTATVTDVSPAGNVPGSFDIRTVWNYAGMPDDFSRFGIDWNCPGTPSPTGTQPNVTVPYTFNVGGIFTTCTITITAYDSGDDVITSDTFSGIVTI